MDHKRGRQRGGSAAPPPPPPASSLAHHRAASSAHSLDGSGATLTDGTDEESISRSWVEEHGLSRAVLQASQGEDGRPSDSASARPPLLQGLQRRTRAHSTAPTTHVYLDSTALDRSPQRPNTSARSRSLPSFSPVAPSATTSAAPPRRRASVSRWNVAARVLGWGGATSTPTVDASVGSASASSSGTHRRRSSGSSNASTDTWPSTAVADAGAPSRSGHARSRRDSRGGAARSPSSSRAGGGGDGGASPSHFDVSALPSVDDGVALPRYSMTRTQASRPRSDDSLSGTSRRCHSLLSAPWSRGRRDSARGPHHGGAGRRSSSSESARTTSLSTSAPRPRTASMSSAQISTANSTAAATAAKTPLDVRVWPFTEALPVPSIAAHVRECVEWYRAMRQLIFAVPLLFFVGFYAVTTVHRTNTQMNVYETELLRQRLERSAFPSPAAEMERFRQQQLLRIISPNLGVSLTFADIRSQTDWMDFAAEMVIPSMFPGVTAILNRSFQAPERCTHDGNVSRGSHKGRQVPVAASDDSGDSGDGVAAACRPDAYLYEKEERVGPGEHVLVGALRVRTIRMRPHSATLQSRMYPDNTSAVPQDAWSRHHERWREETTPSRCPSLTLTTPFTGVSSPIYVYRAPEEMQPYCVAISGHYGSYHCGGYMFDIPFRATAWLAAQFQAAIGSHRCFFADNWATRFIAIEFFTYTPSTDSFHMVRYQNEVSAAGAYVNTAVHHSFPVWTTARTGELVYVCFTIAYVAVYACLLLARLYELVRSTGRVVPLLWNWGAWADLGAIVSLSVSFAYYFLWLRLSIAVAPRLSAATGGLDAYPIFLSSVARLYDSHTIAVATGVLLSFSRLCTLRVVLRPLDTFLSAAERCSGTLVVVATLYLLLVVGYALAASAVFGPVDDFYSTFGASLFTCLTVWAAAPIVIPSGENVSHQFAFAFIWSLLFVAGVMGMSLGLANLLYEFAEVQQQRGISSEAAWLRTSVRRLQRGLSCAWQKRFWATVLYLPSENDHLHRLLTAMEALCGGGGASSPSGSCSSSSRPTDGNGAAHGAEGGGSWTAATTALVAQRLHEMDTHASRSEWHSTQGRSPSSVLMDGDGGVTAGTVTPHRAPFTVPPPSSSDVDNLGAPQSASRVPQQWLSHTELRSRLNHLQQRRADGGAAGAHVVGVPAIDFSEWLSLLPSGVVLGCGGRAVLAEWWVDWTEARASTAATQDRLRWHHLEEWSAAAIEREVAGGVAGIGHLDATLCQLEAHVDMLLQHVSRR
ncbi:Polycystin cation channel [Novymonas esmeraldas]|uniref:Polycystin cation channel n=1 Tax=Novymonas esmeraldas TaxID=1808958 RepID=A0AAW0F3F2_9TRYP